MTTSEDLISALGESTKAEETKKLMSTGSARHIFLDGLCGSSAALLFAKLRQELQPSCIFVLNDEEDAGYFYNDLVQAAGDKDILFFPSSYKRAIKYNQKDSANEILRTETLARLSTNSNVYIVSYPEAISENVASRNILDESAIDISTGDTIDLTMLEKKLHEQGFARADYVYEPGFFAIRGSIIDVFSFSCEYPFRIDLFGDEVDSIRKFDVETQLSTDKIEHICILPEISGSKETVSILDFIGDDFFVVCKDINYITEKQRAIYEEGFSRQALIENIDGLGNTDPDKERDKVVTNPDKFTSSLSRKRLIQLSSHASGQKAKVEFKTTLQPLFHKSFDLLTKELKRLQNRNYTIHILSDSAKQIDRIKDILAEFSADIEFTPVKKSIHEGFIDETTRRVFFTDHQIFDRFHKFNLKSDRARSGKIALSLKELSQFEIGDYIVHFDHGIGVFGGLVRVPNSNGQGSSEMIKICYQDNATIYVSIHALHKVSKYKGKEGEAPRISKLGTGAWERMKDRVKTKVKDIARDLIRLYAKRREEKGFAFSHDTFMQNELEASFMYEDTPDQLTTTQDVKADMERERPMDRLVCGDVGFGKTEIAVRAAFKAATDSKQTAILVPTTILAYQHYQTFLKRLKNFPVRVEYLSRARTAKETRLITEDLANGKIDIIIGTHKLIGKSVKFKDLGLLIIDEEQKFGVSVKEKLRQLKVNVDTLTLTATPIPRTLQFSLMGARDLSVIHTPPPNRYPIQTEIHTFSPEVIAEAINFEMSRNGQVFFVTNRISDLTHIEDVIHKYVPDARVCIGHGRMEPKDLEKVVLDFMNFDYDVMLSTTIVENGVDIPNANTIIINAANHYGLSDLHQMRGRVGRGNRKAFCYLLAPPLPMLNEESRRRLQAIENFSGLGSGINIAMQDLDIRGAGNMLGAEQSGFIADVGYETYQKILGEAVKELREDEFAEILSDDENQTDDNPKQTIHVKGYSFVTDCTLESDLELLLPELYVPTSGERMSLYRELDSLTGDSQLDLFRQRLIDRFGKMPRQAEELLEVMPLKWQACRLGVEKIVLKGGKMVLHLVHDKESAYYRSDIFSKIIKYASANFRRCLLADGKSPNLTITGVTSIKAAKSILTLIEETKV